jgi:hypothetical protein
MAFTTPHFTCLFCASSRATSAIPNVTILVIGESHFIESRIALRCTFQI